MNFECSRHICHKVMSQAFSVPTLPEWHLLKTDVEGKAIHSAFSMVLIQNEQHIIMCCFSSVMLLQDPPLEDCTLGLAFQWN